MLKKSAFCKSLKINTRLKKFNFLAKKFLHLFADIKNSTTVALAFGKQRGNAVENDSMMILETIPYRQAVQRSLFVKIGQRNKCKVRNEKRTVDFQ